MKTDAPASMPLNALSELATVDGRLNEDVEREIEISLDAYCWRLPMTPLAQDQHAKGGDQRSVEHLTELRKHTQRKSATGQRRSEGDEVAEELLRIGETAEELVILLGAISEEAEEMLHYMLSAEGRGRPTRAPLPDTFVLEQLSEAAYRAFEATPNTLDIPTRRGPKPNWALRLLMRDLAWIWECEHGAPPGYSTNEQDYRGGPFVRFCVAVDQTRRFVR